ncbi:hypothetical protein ymoll0001_2120 [Yersinia mollaretii ATCC 43969]|uniref:Uncharacterized protein n=1 Tax=Yersinia mollaretii (strain ATCC 43969 / DSM 18520 / CIP 103324 / CNY 7263 / WAIP 204) TaxID=349967 RepID=A0ABM9YAH7_YERMW|nr:hypothetical protein ymoll0001_2120 [Yersinia mollaretii ATCC 43969]
MSKIIIAAKSPLFGYFLYYLGHSTDKLAAGDCKSLTERSPE